jgi:hypothetical protein
MAGAGAEMTVLRHGPHGWRSCQTLPIRTPPARDAFQALVQAVYDTVHLLTRWHDIDSVLRTRTRKTKRHG